MTANPEVVFCTYDRPGNLGGPFTWLTALLPALRDLGLPVRVLALTHFGKTGPVVEGLRDQEIQVDVSDCHPHTVDQVRWILENLAKAPPSLFIPNFVVSALFAARWVRRSGCRTIGVLHSDDDYYRAIQDEFLFGKRSCELTDIVTVSMALQKEVTSRHTGRSFISTYIPYGVNVPDTCPRRDRSVFRIAYVGRLAEAQKRISLVTRSFIAAAQSDASIHAVIFGDGPDRSVVQDLLNGVSQPTSVELAGPVPFDQVQSRLQSFDAIVLLSDFEGLPIALLEGMACGCVPVCRNMESGIPQLLSHGTNGVIVSEDVNDFVNAIRELKSNRDRCEAMGLRSRQLVKQYYSQDTSVQCWAELLRNRLTSQLQPITIPRWIDLPKLNPHLESPSSRRTLGDILRSKWARSRIRLGAMRRKLF